MATRFHVRDQRDPGWFWADNEIIDQYVRFVGADGQPVGTTGGMIYMLLARYAGTRGRCHLSLSRIAQTLCLSRPTVIKYLNKLEEAGLIVKVQHRAEGKAEAECNEYVLLKVKGSTPGGQKDLPGSKIDLPPGQTILPGRQSALPDGQPALPPVGNEVDRGGQAALPNKEYLEERLKTGGKKGGKAAAPPVHSPSEETDEGGGATTIPAVLKDADGTLTYPLLAEMCGWYRERFGKTLLGPRADRTALRATEDGLSQIAAAVAISGNTLLGFLDNRCWINQKKRTALHTAADPLAELSAQVAYALEDLRRLPGAGTATTGAGGTPALHKGTWHADGMSEEERKWREMG